MEGGGSQQQDRQPLEPPPISWVTYTLIAVNTLVFALMWRAGHGDVSSVGMAFGNKNNALIHAGQIWRFVTPIFLHGSLSHLLVNSLSLFMLGLQIEQIYGARKYFLVYMIAGITSFVASYVSSPVPSVGASGAIFGLVGAGLVFPVRFRSLIPEQARTQILSQLLLVTAINLGIGFWPGSHIDNFAHMGGLVGGAFVALFLIPDVLLPEDWERTRQAKIRTLAVSAAVAAMLVIIGWAVLRQAQFYRRMVQEMTAPPMRAYGPAGRDPWWSLKVPTTWQPLAGSAGWKSPQGAVVLVVDSMENPQAIQEVLLALEARKKAGQLPRLETVDGKPAAHIVWQTPQTTIDLYVIQAYNRVLAVNLESPTNSYEHTGREFRFILDSMRFVHPPKANDSVPVIEPGGSRYAPIP